jgi:hypothetical protein
MFYRGRLPNYAQHASRARVVRLFCKGEPPHSAWAEMNVDYPGQEVLRQSQPCAFTATCSLWPASPQRFAR